MRAHLRKKNQIQLKFKLSLGYINPMSEKKKLTSKYLGRWPSC